jgi:hypothetical protein
VQKGIGEKWMQIDENIHGQNNVPQFMIGSCMYRRLFYIGGFMLLGGMIGGNMAMDERSFSDYNK